jgi:hypothetical protein
MRFEPDAVSIVSVPEFVEVAKNHVSDIRVISLCSML